MPKLIVRPDALHHNLAVMRDACSRAGASCLFAFKEAPLHPKLAGIVMEGNGIDRLGLVAWPSADFASLPPAALHHLSSPPPTLMTEASTCQAVYLSSRFSLERLAEQCGDQKPALRFTLECGDGRDGLHEDEIEAMASLACRKGFRLLGLSVNFACLSQRAPTLDALRRADSVLELLRRFSSDADISAGGTDMLELAESCTLPASVREIRCGTGVMLGVYPLSGHPVPYARQDTFRFEACVLEVRIKQGRRLALLDFGTFHTAPEYLIPTLPAMRFCGASSAYAVFDVTDCRDNVHEGMVLRFFLHYKSLGRALASRALTL
uniref:alanine racemase n=1 Tax=Mailhella sp. TaxID=1981029 RepID=UPI0040645AB8